MCMDPKTLVAGAGLAALAAGTGGLGLLGAGAAAGAAGTGAAASAAGTGAAAVGGGIASTLANGALMASAASGVIGAYGTYQQGQVQAKASAMSARLYDQSARDAVLQGQQESDNLRRAGAQRLADTRVAQAANGVDVNSADALSYVDSQKQAIEEDAFAIRETARRGAEGLTQQAANARYEARTVRTSSRLAAGGTLLGAASAVGSRYAWMRYQRT